jgi:hypothetical protein
MGNREASAFERIFCFEKKQKLALKNLEDSKKKQFSDQNRIETEELELNKNARNFLRKEELKIIQEIR